MERGGILVRVVRRKDEDADVLTISGELNDDNADVLAVLLRDCRQVGLVDLSELDINGASAALEAVGAVRELLSGLGTLKLFHCPQILAHTLYRVGLLEGGTLELVDPRQEEPYG